MSEWETVTSEVLVVQAEEEALADPTRESPRRWEIVRELHRRSDEAIFEAAGGWCASNESLLKCLAADVLAQFDYSNDNPFAERSEPLLNELLGDPNLDVVSCALVALGHLRRGDLDRILALASHDNSDVRDSVAFCIGPRDDDACRETLLLLSSDTDRDVRNWATFGLGSLSEADTPEIREALSNRLADDDEEVRGEAMLGLAIRGDVRVVPLILAELEGDEVSSLTVQAAAEMPDRSYLPHLEELREANPEDEGIGLAVERCREE